MIRLQNGKVIYNDSVEVGLLEDMSFIGNGFSINVSMDSTIFVPESTTDPFEQEVFAAYREFYKDTGGVKPVPVTDPPIVLEPVDEEKAAMAEAIIDMSQQINGLRTEIEMMKGGN